MLEFSGALNEFPLFLQGAWASILYAVGCLTLGFLLAVMICMARISTVRIASLSARVYINVIRATPLLVVLLIVFNILPFVGVELSPEASALLSLTVCTAGYQAEILRGGFAGVSQGQIEAGRITGMSEWQIFRHIKLPQAFRLTLPALINETTIMIKGTSLISTVGILELTRVAQNVGNSNFRPLEALLIAAALYWLMTTAMTIAGDALIHRYAREKQS
ncbi:polar amino acid transport system permease protein [Mesorhizobium soli]|uniref:amino acid ABC transporter permease n=1 Tax=Pseudaminobacter soli (ex Li et al. 2025) TaxID=1295366 RepID=UPI0024758957|nr:amino acid ABC transporter permease [Mesorhizobium soli]MDH6231776.1 polar amino acid transport system permease protein [Mesorhizobium soli]